MIRSCWRVIVTPLMLLSFAALAACGGSDAGQPGHAFTITEENGVATAVNSAVPKYGGELFTYERVLELRADPDNPESLLYQPSAFTMDADGYYVADTGNHRIAVFDTAGNYVRSIGQRGEGPGELQAPGAIAPASFFLRDGLLWAFVAPRGVTARFRTDGILVDEIPTASLSPRGIALAKTDAGGLVLWEIRNERGDEQMLTGVRIRVFGPNGEAGATIAGVPIPTAAFRTVPGQEQPARAILNYAAWPDAQLVADDEVLLSPGDEPVLRWYDLEGTLQRQVRFDIPMEVMDRERAATAAAVDAAIADAAAAGDDRTASMWRRQKETLSFAERSAPWAVTRVDDAGYLWLFKRFATAAVAAEGHHAYEVRVVGPTGEYLGDTTLPLMAPTAIFGLRIVRGRLLALIDDPETGEPVPAVYEIHPAIEDLIYP